MLRLTASDRYDVVGCGCTIHIPNYTVPNGYSVSFAPIAFNDYQCGYKKDVFFGSTLEYDVVFGQYSAFDLIRMRKADSGPCFTMGNRQVRAVREFSLAEDGGRYGSAFGAHSALSRITATTRRRDWTRETDVSDRSARGALQLSGSSRTFYDLRTEYTRYGKQISIYTYPSIRDGSKIYRQLSVSSVSNGYLFAIGGALSDAGATRQFDLDDFVTRFKGASPFETTLTGGYASNKLSYSGFDLSRDGDEFGGRIVFSYLFTNEATSLRSLVTPIRGIPWSRATYKATHTIDYSVAYLSEKYQSPTTGSFYVDVDAKISCWRMYQLESYIGNCDVPSDWGWQIEPDGSSGPISSSPFYPLQNPGIGRDDVKTTAKGVPILRGIESEQVLRDFGNLVESIHPDIRQAAALSANSCLDSFSSSSNYLESMPELPAMLKSIKDITRFGKLIKLISSGNPKAVPEIIDLLADAYLMYKYGVKPLKSDIDESKRIATEYYEHMDILSKDLPSNLYGEFKYEIPRSLPGIPGTFKVDVRSKLVLRSSPAGILAFILTLDDVGLLPTMARIWDLVPFSFVVDWFTSLGDRFADIDKMVIRGALDLDYYVHTFTYRYLLDPKAYAPFRRSQGSAVPQLRVFKRERSLFHPVIGKSCQFDFHPPSGLAKHNLAAGALLWVSK